MTTTATKMYLIPSEESMRNLGRDLAALVTAPCQIHLKGDLGAGKTTFARGFIQAAGFAGVIRSPTYTLIEPYATEKFPLYHMDLYRLMDAEELENLGVRDIAAEVCVCLIEWPEKGAGYLPKADIVVEIQIRDTQRLVGMTPVSVQVRDAIVKLRGSSEELQPHGSGA